MKKILKKEVIIAFIIGIILSSSIAVYAYSYFASDISYTKPGTNTPISVETALNDLYSKKTENDILNSKKSVVKLSNELMDSSAAHEFDVSNIEGFENFTKDNFIYNFQNFVWVGTTNLDSNANITYNSTTGKVIFGYCIGGNSTNKLSISYYPILIY